VLVVSMEEGLLCMGQPALAGVTIVVRHGARSPNKGEMKPFSASSPVRIQWHHNDGGLADYDAENNLTDYGRDQMRAIGSYFASHPKYSALIKSGRLAWHSSASARVRESGALIGEGLCSTLGVSWPAEPTVYEPDDVFRAWDVKGSLYKKFVDGLPLTDAFVKRSRQASGLLRPCWEKVGGKSGCSETDMLWQSTYLHLMSECEAYSDPALSGGQKQALNSALDEGERCAIEEAACWVWEQRFQGCEQHASYLGGHLWQLVGPSQPRQPAFCVFSGHDYTILSLLAELGIRSYPAPALSYGAFVIVERFTDGTARVLLNAAPFRNPATNVVSRTALCAANERVVAEVGVDGAVSLVPLTAGT